MDTATAPATDWMERLQVAHKEALTRKQKGLPRKSAPKPKPKAKVRVQPKPAPTAVPGAWYGEADIPFPTFRVGEEHLGFLLAWLKTDAPLPKLRLVAHCGPEVV